MSEGERPFAWARQLEDAAARWLRPGPTEEEARLLNLVVLEQFVEGLPEATARWVRCHQVPDLTTAVTLAEDHLVAEPPPAPQASRPRGGASERPPAAAACCCRLLLGGGEAWSVGRREPVVVARGIHSQCCSRPQMLTDLTPARSHEEPHKPDYWKCGRPGHLRRDCPLMEVGQVFHVAGAPAPAPGLGGTYRIPVRCRGGIRHALVDWLYADPASPKLGLPWGIVGSRVGGVEMCAWGYSEVPGCVAAAEIQGQNA